MTETRLWMNVTVLKEVYNIRNVVRNVGETKQMHDIIRMQLMLIGGILLVEWERLSDFDPSYINLHGNETLYNMLV